MIFKSKYWRIVSVLFFLISCKNNAVKNRELLFWCSNNNQEIELATAIKNTWNRENGTMPVHMQPIPEGQSSEEVILAAVVGKSPPDIYANMWQGSVETYARAGVLIPLDTIAGFMNFIKERCNDDVIKEITSSDGHIYQVPWKVNPIMTIYNKKLFTDNNIHDLPKTYNSYIKAADDFKNNNKGLTITKRFGYTAVRPIWYEREFNFYTLYIAASNGAPLIVNNRAAFNNKYAIEVFRFLQTLYTNDYFSKENNASSSDPFVIQTIATKWTGPWEIAHLNNIPDRGFDFDYFLPIVPDEHKGPVYTYADPKNIVMFNTCANPREAWNFIKTMVDKKGDLQLLETTGQLPRRKNLDTDEFYENYFKSNPMMLPFAKEVAYVKGIDNCESIVEVFDIISQEYEACVIYGKKTPEKAIADAERAVNVLLGQKNN